MYVTHLRPVTPTLRFKTKFIRVESFKTKNSRFILKKKTGHNSAGRYTTRAKAHRNKFFTQSFYLSQFRTFTFLVRWINTNPSTRNCFNLFKTNYGIFFNLPAISGNTVGSVIRGGPHTLQPLNFVALGLPCLLRYVPYFFNISNLYFLNKKKITYACASGTFCNKLKSDKKTKLLKVELPSAQIKFLQQTAVCLVGKNHQNNKNKFVVGKAGFNILMGKNKTVRGVAKNPVDHPNGGRTKSCQPELSPWGWVAKRNK